ncbi:unnamed protein product [Lymnaea stagnalis]|uniref:MRH domain-containing protein n=1 Tax=Lymnaea stagnalis TaxID=6523 RepID=A0AAV2H0H8_LYMST
MAAATVHGRKIFLLLLLFSSLALADVCKIGSFDVSTLHSFSPWNTVNDFQNATIQISLCSKLAQDKLPNAHNCPDGTSICLTYPNGTSISYGNYSSNASVMETPGGPDGVVLLMLKGQPCPGHLSEFYSTIFYFKCGKTLGYPKYMGDFLCSTHFEWKSYLFCKNLPAPEKEVPCAVVKDGSLIDLSPLTKLTGAHLVEADETHQRKIFINVCRDITPGNDTKNCPKGSAACRVLAGSADDFGQPITALESTNEGARLVYTSTTKPDKCLLNPSTTINFRCPERGGSKPPILLTDFLVSCSATIEWVTEFACPTDYITSSTCQLNKEEHDIDIDLSLLKHPPLQPYVVPVTDGKDHYLYYINICDTVAACNNDGVSSVCQRKDNDSTFSQSLGKKDSMELMYSDGVLTLTYKNGNLCSSNFERETVIEFSCNRTAVNDGLGAPEFVQHTNCSYFFQWATKLACVDQPADRTCRLDVDGKRFDLSELMKEKGHNWQVITGENEADNMTYFLNVCHDVLPTGDASTCPLGSAVCRKGSSGSVSLGRFTQSLQYDKASQSLRLNYTEPSQVAGKCSRSTTVSFYCAPGNLVTAPNLVYKSIDDCHFDIEWQTAAACVLSRKTGDNCRVFDDSAGYSFDLNPLTLDKGSYSIDGPDGYKYLLNVCARISDDKYCTTKSNDNAAICQIKEGPDRMEFKVGEPSSKLEYFDGVLNLTYVSGEPYNDANKTPRSAEIAFICDLAAGVGKPEFLEEKNLTYAFLWRTSYACPVNPIECAVTNGETHQQYDLSSLTKTSQPWEIESNLDPNNRKKFYVNVCRPIGPVRGVLCSPLASVCATNVDGNGKETVFHGNLGQAMTSPVIERSIKGVKLIYTNGDSCVDEDNIKRKFTTTIHFACVKGKLVGGPTSPLMISPCEYSILWETEAACAIDNVQTQDTENSTCTVKDPNSGFVFNLTPLAKDSGYDILDITGSKTFKVNLCHALPDSVCGTFSVSNSTGVCDGQTAVAQVSSSLEYSSQGEITLTYNGKTDFASGSNTKYVFNFFCDRSAQQAQILFSGVEYLSTNFHVKTALACAPQPVSCVVQDALGRQYDLTPLAREVGNWVVIDSRPNHGDLRYHINVCRPVNPTAGMTCAGGAVGACQTSSQRNESFSMGFVQSEPVVSSTNSAVTIHYEGGERCHIGKDHEALRSTRIIFFCDTVEHNPVFEAESDSCEYTFVWKTPSACPQKVVSGSDCKVTEPLYNFEFDLSTLRTTTKDYIVKGNNYEFHINVCGPLINGPGQCQSAGACQVGSTLSSPIPTGLPNNQPKYESGQITLVYSDGKSNCHQKYNRSTIIIFVCDHSQVGDAGPQYLEERSDCTYVFEWPTKAACPPHQVTECTVENGKDIYDLSRLSRPDSNYQRVYNDSNREYIINICRSLVHKKGQTCPFDAAACMIDLAETDPKKRYHNIGGVTSHSLRIEQGVLVLSYDNGEPCGTGTRSTTIVFQCDERGDFVSTPSSHFELNGCEDHFVWLSSAACPLREDDQPSQGFGNCKATNPNTGYEFDLNSLKKDEGYTTYDRDGHEFVLNVCGWLDTKSHCINGTGNLSKSSTSVGAKKSVSSGLANGQLLYKDGVLVLEYKDGEKCSTAGVSRATSINFVCDQDAGKGVPVYIDKSGDCNVYFTWETDLACETEVKCEVDTDSGFTLDFSSLIMKSGNNLVLPLDAGSHHNVGLIYVNLCRPLNPIFGTLCPPGSAACLVRLNEPPLNLGHIDQEPVYDKVTKEVKLTYTKGDSCSSNPKVNITSVIILKCSTDTGTSPELEDVTQDCQYVFVWETPLACPEPTAQKLSTDCSYYDHHLRVKYDLSSLSDPVQVKSANATFILQPCNTEEKINRGSCSKSAVCQTDAGSAYGSYGDFSHGMFQKDSDLLSLTFSEGKACNAGKSKAESTIFFQCDRTAGMGQPKIMTYESDCHVSFLWLTSLVCPQAKKKCLISSNGALFDFTFLSQDHGSWNVTDKDNNIYWLNLCQGVHGEATLAGCTESTAVCRKTASGKIELLGKLDTQQITAAASSGTNTTVSFRYSDGDAAVCGSGGRRRSDIAPNVSIKLICGNTIGAPVFQVFKSDGCSFEFLWKTRLACAVSHDKLQVKQVNGVIYDVRTGLSLNLKSILEPTKSYEVTVNSDKYYINFGREVDLGIQQNIGCKGAAVCLKDTSSNTFRNLGALSSVAYFMEDEHLEIVFTSPENCSSGHLNVTTIFIFNCIEDNGLTKPSFVYKTSDCGYIFNWDTNVVCLKGNPAVQVPVIDSSSDEPRPSNEKDSKKVVLGVAIFIFIALVCISVLVLYKPERRAIIGSKLKRIVLCRKSQDGPIVYSRLSQSDGNEDDPFNPFNETEDESEINNSQLPPRVSTFHDDSDDDMLL